MIVALQTLVTCPFCGHKIRYVGTAMVRVNKRSCRVNGVIIGFLAEHLCPGCGEEIRNGQPLEREPYVVMPEDAARIAAYRLARWGIESTGADVERVAG